jgi:hypothetical protein
LLLFLWTLWLLAALSLLPKPLPLILLPSFAVILAGFPLLHAHHLTWRAFLMLWLAVDVVFAATSIRIARRQIVTAAASAVGLLWIGFQGGGTYSWYAERTLLAAVVATVLVGISAGMLLLVSEHRAVVRQRAASAPEPEAPDPTALAPSWVFAEHVVLYVVPATDGSRFMVRRDVGHAPDDGATLYWATRDAYPAAGIADACGLLASTLSYVVSFPIQMAAAQIRAPAADFVLEPAERALARAEQVCLIAGVVAGTATGLHPLELNLTMMPGHNAVEQPLEKAVATAIHDMVAGPAPTRPF